MFRSKKILSFISVILIALFMLVGCSCSSNDEPKEETTTKVKLPERVSLVDPELDSEKLEIGSDVQFAIDVPEGKEIDKLTINNEDKTSTINNNKFTTKIKKGLDIKVTFKDATPVSTKCTVTLVGEGLRAEKDAPLTNVEPGTILTVWLEAPTGDHTLDEFKIDGEKIQPWRWDINGPREVYYYTFSVNNSLTVEAKFKKVKFTVNYSINDGTIILSQKVRLNKELTDEFILEETGITEWTDSNGNKVTFPFNYTYTNDITLTATVAPLDESKFEYEDIDSTSVMITKINNAEEDKVIIIPEMIAGKSVVSTKDMPEPTVWKSYSLFAINDMVKCVKLPNTMTILGMRAFYYEAELKYIVLSNNMEVISDSAFYGAAMTTLTIPKSLEEIGPYAFAICDLVEVIIPDDSNLVLIDDGAFKSNELKEFKITSKVEEIGDEAFGHMESLVYIVIPSNVTTMGEDVFSRHPYWNNEHKTTVYIDNAEIPAGWHSDWGKTAEAFYLKPDWAYDENGVPHPVNP